MTISPRWWQIVPPKTTAESTNSTQAQCYLCAHQCIIPLGKAGYCGARFFDTNGFSSPFLGRFCSIAVDPMEKKPLYHFQPGSFILSLGSLGCTMRCPFCQNHGIAQPVHEPTMQSVSVETLLQTLQRNNLKSVAFTYNEPTLQAEYILTASPLLRENGIATILVTNGIFSDSALDDLLPCIDALNIDVKTFNPRTYAKLGGSLEQVMRSVSRLVAAEKHVELTTLVVPGISDMMDEFDCMISWIHTLSPDIPLHISRYFPAHTYTAPSTDIRLLQRFKQHASSKLHHVHLGNVGIREK